MLPLQLAGCKDIKLRSNLKVQVSCPSNTRAYLKESSIDLPSTVACPAPFTAVVQALRIDVPISSILSER